MITKEKKKGKRGFGAMSPEKVREIARKGGRRVQEMGIAHRWTSGPDGTARIAGKKGGALGHRKPKVEQI